RWPIATRSPHRVPPRSPRPVAPSGTPALPCCRVLRARGEPQRAVAIPTAAHRPREEERLTRGRRPRQRRRTLKRTWSSDHLIGTQPARMNWLHVGLFRDAQLLSTLTSV